MRSVGLVTLLALAGLAFATHAAAPPLTIDASTVGAPGSNAPAELFRPDPARFGEGPRPGMVVLHGCDGIGRHYRQWARDLASWGYVAVLVDSFRPRGLQTVCNHGLSVPPLERARDAFAAAEYLRGLKGVRGDRIGVIGFSHGGWTALKAVLAGTVESAGAPPFAAAVAFYPGCEVATSPLASDTLILMGDADDWTPVDRCVRWHNLTQSAGHALEMKVYHGARHGFDAPMPPHWYAGHYVGRDPEAASAAMAETRDFLAARLQQ